MVYDLVSHLWMSRSLMSMRVKITRSPVSKEKNKTKNVKSGLPDEGVNIVFFFLIKQVLIYYY